MGLGLPICENGSLMRGGAECDYGVLRYSIVVRLAVVLATLVLEVALVLLDAARCPAFAEDSRNLATFSWKMDRTTGKELALSRSDNSFNYFDVGDLSYYSLYLVQRDLGRISAATGLTIDRSSKTSSSIAIVHDTKVFSRLKNDKQSFRVLGIPDNIIALLEQGISDDTKCASVTVDDGQSNVLFSVILLSEKFDQCLVRGILESFGVVAPDLGIDALVSACALYEGRRLGVRDRESLSEKTPKLRELCLAKAGERK